MVTLFVKKVITFIVFFIAGSWNTVFSNILYHTKGVGYHNRHIVFRRPWFQTWAMFLGMMIPLCSTRLCRKCSCPEYTGGKLRGWPLYRVCAIPACGDLAGSVFENIALIYLTPSVWQMLRGSIVIFTALGSIFYRKRRLIAVDWFGLFVIVVGIVIIGASSIFEESPSNQPQKQTATIGLQLMSMFFVIISQAMQMVRAIGEEVVLHDIDATPEEVVGFEGLWGLHILTFIGLPLANIMPEDAGVGIFEPSLESFKMLASSWRLAVLMLGYVLAVSAYNLSGMMLTQYTTALHRTVYDSLRSISTWVVSVMVYYAWPSSESGERLSWWSFLRLFGFGVLLLGSLIYHRMVRVACFKYQDEWPIVSTTVPPSLSSTSMLVSVTG
jgi:drug/metabolite transporter (DMT)-like permease